MTADSGYALLSGGPKAGETLPLDGWAHTLVFSRVRDDGRHVRVLYEFDGTSFRPGSTQPYRFAGEEDMHPAVAACWEPTRRERRREYWGRLGRAIRGKD